jgi:hypothetical protein
LLQLKTRRRMRTRRSPPTCAEVVYSLSDVPDPRGPLTRNWHCPENLPQNYKCQRWTKSSFRICRRLSQVCFRAKNSIDMVEDVITKDSEMCSYMIFDLNFKVKLRLLCLSVSVAAKKFIIIKWSIRDILQNSIMRFDLHFLFTGQT